VPTGIIEALCEDHNEVRDLFRRVETATGTRKKELFEQLVGEIIRHEVAEEEILRPISQRDAGKAIAQARMKEEGEAEGVLKEMERLDPSSSEFDKLFAKLRTAVERHAEAEETKEFPRIAKKESPEQLHRMGQAYEFAKRMAPTRPHPAVPNTPLVNMLVGPLAAVIDRSRDAVRQASQDLL
jgi:iron-sulfur cluster repair protein YtfE (RIC family)